MPESGNKLWFCWCPFGCGNRISINVLTRYNLSNGEECSNIEQPEAKMLHVLSRPCNWLSHSFFDICPFHFGSCIDGLSRIKSANPIFKSCHPYLSTQHHQWSSLRVDAHCNHFEPIIVPSSCQIC